jgi:hypothetical protein
VAFLSVELQCANHSAEVGQMQVGAVLTVVCDDDPALTLGALSAALECDEVSMQQCRVIAG